MSVLFCSSKLLTSGSSGSINTIGALFEQEVIHELGLYQMVTNMNPIQRIVRRLMQKAHHLFQDPSIQPALAGMSCTARSDDLRAAPTKSVLEDMREGILLAVQRNRRSVERRMWRRIGMPQFAHKLRRDLKCCVECGHMHEAHTLCGNCYMKIRIEAEAIQKAIVDSFSWNPIEQDVVVKYKGEEIRAEDKSKRIIEMLKERPKFFSNNLLEKGNHS